MPVRENKGHAHPVAAVRFSFARPMPHWDWLARQASRQACHITINKGKIMKLDSLKTLYTEELRDLYNAENQLLKALPKMAKKASNPELKEAFQNHLTETRTHVERLDEIFDRLGKKPTGKTCKAMKGLIEEGSEIMSEDGLASVLDAGIIAAAQRVEHYEMAGYGTVRTFASILGEDEAEDLLQETLDEEGAADKKLTEIAESIVNEEADEAAPAKRRSRR
jgi:ferritin-like metal-binding protein YciE